MSKDTVTVPAGAVKVVGANVDALVGAKPADAKAAKPTVSEKPAEAAGKKAKDKKAAKDAVPFKGGKKVEAAKPAVKKAAAKAKPVAKAPAKKAAAAKPAKAKPVAKAPAKKAAAAKAPAKVASKKAPVKQTAGKSASVKKPQPVKGGERHGTYTNATMGGLSREGTLGEFIKAELMKGTEPAQIEKMARKRKAWANSKSLPTYIRVARKQLRDNKKLK